MSVRLRGRRLAVVGALLACAVAATAQSPDGPPDYTEVEQTQCWSCHGPGNWEPDMDPLVLLVPEPTDLVPGDRLDLGMTVYNSWIVADEDFELSGLVASMDLRDAPSLRFVSDRDAVQAGPVEGTIPYDPVGHATDPGTAAGLPQYLLAEHAGHVVVQVPDGATQFLITVRPLDEDPRTAPDLRVWVYPVTPEPRGTPSLEADAAGPGAPETVHVDGAAAFGTHGYGDWTVQAVTRVVDPDTGRVVATQGDVPFVVETTAWFDVAGTVQVVGSDAVLRSGEDAPLSWPVAVVEAPQAGETVRGYLNVTGHYRHDGPEPDWQDFAIPFEFPLNVPEGAGAHAGHGAHEHGAQADSESLTATWGTATVVAFEEPPFLRIADVSEAVGYASTFLLVASLWSGGVLGQRSRVRMNRVFGSARRRVAFHNALSYGILALAVVHTVLFVVEVNYHWLLGMLWGGGSILAMLLLGVTGALQVPLIRRWDYATWKWTHFGLAIAAVVLAVVHILLDGTHFGAFQEAVGWHDPLVPDDRQ